jgi:hypothetical protein
MQRSKTIGKKTSPTPRQMVHELKQEGEKNSDNAKCWKSE